MLKKLRTKFICINMVFLSVMLVIIFGLIFRFTQQSLKAESLDMMESIGSSPLEIFSPNEYREEINLPYFVLQIDKLGNVIATGGGYYDLSDKEFLMEVLRTVLEEGTESGTIEKYQLRFLRVNYITGQRLVFADMSSEKATLGNLVRICLLVGLLALGAFWVLSIFLARWAIRPVAEAWEMQKQFVADASHELKTPLTVILTNAELLQSPEYSEEDRQRFAASVLQMAQAMRALVERLLTLARMDNNAENMEMEELDFSALVEESLLPFEPVYFERGLTLESNLPENLMVTGSREHLRQVLDILLDNAMKYSAVPGSVWVYLKRQGNQCVLAVSNPGDPIEKADLENIFKRFYRVDKARTRDGSTGLGLPIALSIVKEHRGKLWVESSGGYNTFFVELPLN